MSKDKEAPLITGKKIEFKVVVLPEDALKLEELLNDKWQGIPPMSGPSWVTLAKEK